MAPTSHTQPSWGSRLTGVEGLRACAALSVLGSHSVYESGRRADLGFLERWLVPNLAQGLTLFFTLSGFLLFRPFAAAILDDRPLPSARAFLRNRALRILPAYWAILLFAALVAGVAVTTPGDSTATGYLTDPWTLIKDMLFLQNYAPSSVDTGIVAAWTLSIEAVFYLCLPLLALAAIRLARGRARAARVRAALLPPAVLLVLGLVGKGEAHHTEGSGSYDMFWGRTWHAALERSFLSWADLFAFGMAAAVVTLVAQGRHQQRFAALRPFCGVAALALGFALVALQAERGLGDRFMYTPMGLVCALLLLWVVLPGPERRNPVLRALESRPLVWLGVVSYSIYLWHQPVIYWLRDHHLVAGGVGGTVLQFLVATTISAGLATITYKYIEAPAMRRKARLTPRTPARIAPEPADVQAAP